jgi:hypothetical protein
MAFLFDKLLARIRTKDTKTIIIQRLSTGFSNYFSSDDSPKITDYWTIYGAVYGEVPAIQLITINPDGTLRVRNDIPATLVESRGHLDVIEFDLPAKESGFIILS